MQQYGIIGYPLKFSFSQNYYTKKFLEEGILDASYSIFPIETAAEIKNILQQNSTLKGLNVTIPHKKNVIPFLTNTTNLPAGLNACNCIKIEGENLIGYNTDIVGFEKSLLPLLQPHHNKALILGNGGAANAVKYVLQKLNIPFLVVGRKMMEGIDLLYENLNEEILQEHLLIVNTTPVGTFPTIDECPIIPYQYLTKKHLLYDLIYNPEKTLFLQKGEEQGAAIKNGYEMLLLQAEENWRIWSYK
jgi:shikimate dehydrogenase